jgi:catechol 2,3-dioxygenase-like lactoylglutathione lyase family enzyme
LAAGSRARRWTRRSLANGGSDEGPPGPRDNGSYAAYFRDPDGNKLNTYSMSG